MTLYMPSAFAIRQREAALQLIAAHPFATLITALDGAEPQITHLPLLYRDEALWGHLARANPHAALLARGAPSLAVFHGPHAYVSPRGYETPAQHVPTWNYAVVHVAGRPELLDEAAARRLLDETTAHFDPGFVSAEARVAQLLPAIVAFRMPVVRLDAKFKMSQNRSAADRAGVVAMLAASEDGEARAVAAWMRAHE